MCCSLPHCESSVTPSCSPETRESLGGNKGVLPSRSHLKLPLLHPCLIELEKESGWLDPSPTAYSWRASQVGTVDLGFWQQSVKKKKKPSCFVCWRTDRGVDHFCWNYWGGTEVSLACLHRHPCGASASTAFGTGRQVASLQACGSLSWLYSMGWARGPC